jgi:hypothetical protein
MHVKFCLRDAGVSTALSSSRTVCFRHHVPAQLPTGQVSVLSCPSRSLLFFRARCITSNGHPRTVTELRLDGEREVLTRFLKYAPGGVDRRLAAYTIPSMSLSGTRRRRSPRRDVHIPSRLLRAQYVRLLDVGEWHRASARTRRVPGQWS